MLPKRAYGIYAEKGEGKAEKKRAPTGANHRGDFKGVNEDEEFLGAGLPRIARIVLLLQIHESYRTKRKTP